MIELRRIQEIDLQTRVKWMNNDVVYGNMHFIPPISIENTQRWYIKNLNNETRLDVVFEDNGNLVAMGGLTNIDYKIRKAEFYIFVNPELHHQGYGKKSTYLLCKYGFDVLQLHKIFLYANCNNERARRTYEAVGFKLEGRLRDEMLCHEKYLDRVYYGLLSNELIEIEDELILSGGTV